jgi:D-alanyl-D-alanine carboxypeptidase
MAAALVFTPSSRPTLAQAGAPRLEPMIRDYAKGHNFNGTILIQSRDKTIYHKSFGIADRAFSVPCQNDTKYKVASITKAFTAVLILQLYDEGKLDLHGTIKTHLPSYTGEGAERVTVHHLLGHTSGIQNFDTVTSYQEGFKNGVGQYQAPLTTDQLLTRYCSGKLVNEVGKVFDYNNGDYIILGKIIEAISGKTYERMLTDRILEPLGMRDSGMLYQHTIVTNLANTYFLRDDLNVMINDMPVYIENWYSAGALYSTTADLAKFASALYASKLLKRETLSLMLSPGLDDYGYGVWIRNIEVGGKQYRIAQRPGSIMGANSELLHVIDKDLTIVILSNTNTADLDDFSYRIGRALIR